MTISSTIGYNLPTTERIIQEKPNKSVDQPKSQPFTTPASIPLPQTSVPLRSGGLLSSINVTEILKLTDAPPVDVSTLKAPLSGREFLSETIKRSQAAFASGNAVTGSLTSLYTQKDVDTIRAATGYNLVVTNNLTTVVDDNGNGPGVDVATNVMNLAGSIEMARLGGGLKGEMTPDFLKGVFAGYEASGTPLPSGWLAKGLDYLESTQESKPNRD